MTVPSGFLVPLPELRRDLHIAEFATEYVVWDRTCGLVHLLDGLHAVVFDACRTFAGRDALAADIRSVAAPAPDAAADPAVDIAIDAALDHLRGLSLFADGGGRPP